MRVWVKDNWERGLRMIFTVPPQVSPPHNDYFKQSTYSAQPPTLPPALSNDRVSYFTLKIKTELP